MANNKTIIIVIILLVTGTSALVHADTKALEWDKALTSQDTTKLNEKPFFSQKGFFELGGVGGMPSGLNLRYWFVDFFGFDMTFGSSLQRDFSASFDLLFEPVEFYASDSLRLRFFFGLGTLVGYNGSGLISNVRLPVGLSMPFMRYALTLSCFAAPALVVKPEIDFDVNWGIAVRFNFGIASAINKREKNLNNRVISLQDGYDRISEKLDMTTDDLDRAMKELNRTGGELTAARGKLNKTMESLNSTKEALDSTRSELSSTKETLDSTRSELTETKGKLGKTREELAGIKKELDSTKTELDSTRQELGKAKKRLDDRERELLDKQAELDNARSILSREMSGQERKDAEKELARKQDDLNREMEEFSRAKEAWMKKNEKQKQQRENLKIKCEARRGIINEEGYCDCREHEQWNSDRSACVCVKGYRLNSKTDRCEPCETVNYNGTCTDECADDEKKVPLSKGPHKYVCVKKCRKKNEVWSEKKNTCLCKDGYYRDENGECVPRR